MKDHAAAYGLAEETIVALRALGQGPSASRSNTLVDELEAKAVMLAQRARTAASETCAIEAVLACVYMDAGAALAQVGSCARNTGANAGQSEAIARWQLEYLQEKV